MGVLWAILRLHVSADRRAAESSACGRGNAVGLSSSILELSYVRYDKEV